MNSTVMQPAILAACIVLVVVSPGAPAEPFDGRWAADLSACASVDDATSLIVVTSQALRWREVVCAVRTSYRVRDAWHIGARCWADGGTSDVPIKLQVEGGRLILNWAGARPEKLRRCP